MKAPSVEQYIKDLKAADNDPEQIEAIATKLWESVSVKDDGTAYTAGSIDNNLKDYNQAVRAAFPASELKLDVNAYLFERKNGLLETRHKHFQFTTDRNRTDRDQRNAEATENMDIRMENPALVHADPYLQTMINLLNSSDDCELAAGLIAASGRRSIEILYLGQFSKTADPYTVKFKGQAKLRDYEISEAERMEYEIRLLIPAEIFLKLWRKFKKSEAYKSLVAKLKQKETELGDLPIEKKQQILRREYHQTGEYRATYNAVKDHFLKTGIFEKLENIPHKKGHGTHILRSATVNLLAQRDESPKGNAPGRLISFAAKQLGHKGDKNTARDFVATQGYINFDVIGQVPTLDNAFKTATVRINHSDLDRLNELGTRLNAQNQQQTLNWLLNQSDRVIELERELADLRQQLASQPQPTPAPVEPQPASAPVEPTTQPETMDIEQLIERKIREALGQVAAAAPIASQPAPAPTAPAETAEATETAPAIDPKYQLKRAKSQRGVEAEKKVNDAFWAVADYNDQQLADKDKWYVTARLLKDLSGVNYAVVKRWLAANETTVEEHNQRNGLSETHNRSHGRKGISITDLVSI